MVISVIILSSKHMGVFAASKAANTLGNETNKIKNVISIMELNTIVYAILQTVFNSNTESPFPGFSSITFIKSNNRMCFE